MLLIKTSHATLKYNFINILDRFQTISHTFEDINFINKSFLKPSPINNTLPHLFYTNTKTTTHNKRIFKKTPGKIFISTMALVLLILNY
jgi:hypothetical protein